MSKEITSRAQDYSQWYNDLIIKGGLADLIISVIGIVSILGIIHGTIHGTLLSAMDCGECSPDLGLDGDGIIRCIR